MAADGCTLSLGEGPASVGIRLVLEYCNLPPEKCEVTVSQGKEELVGRDGASITGRNTICRYLASLSENSAKLLGKTPQEKAEVSQWLNHVYTNLEPLVDSKLHELDKFLASHSFFVGTNITLADLVIFAAIHPAVSSFPKAQIGYFCNLIRWCDCISHSADKSALYSPLEISRPSFDFSLPSSSAPSKVPKPDAKDNAAGKGKGEGAKPSSASGATATASATSSSAGPSTATSAGQQGKKEKKEKKEKKVKEPAQKKVVEAKIDMLDLRVGKIVKVERHPDADALYLEQIDLGEAKPRQVISGLVKFVPIEKMQDRMVIVVCNLKPANMRGILSSGMVLCASDESHEKCDPLIPPEGVSIGEKVTFQGYTDPPSEEIKPKQKILEKLFPDLVTDDQGVAKYKEASFETTKGVVTSIIPKGLVR